MVPIINKYHSLSHYVLTSKYSCKISTTYWEQEKYFSKLTCPHLNKCTTYLTCTDHKLACPKKTGNKNYWIKGWTHKQVCGQYKLNKLCTCAPVNERVRFLTLKTHFQKPLKEECFFEDVLKCDYEKFCIISWFFFPLHKSVLRICRAKKFGGVPTRSVSHPAVFWGQPQKQRLVGWCLKC